MKSRFEQISPSNYELAAVLVHEIGQQLLSRLDPVALKPKRIIEVGCGTGYCTKLLQVRYPMAERIAIEDTSTMLAYANAAYPLQATWLCAALDALPVEDNSVDLLVANLVLPWCTDLMKLLKEWQRVLRPEGLLMLSSLGLDTLHELKDHTTLLPSLIDMHDLGDALLHAGFDAPVVDREDFILTYKEQQQLEEELQWMGFLSQEKRLKPLEKNTQGVISLSYEVIYSHAWKAETNKEVIMESGIAKFPLAYLRQHKLV